MIKVVIKTFLITFPVLSLMSYTSIKLRDVFLTCNACWPLLWPPPCWSRRGRGLQLWRRTWRGPLFLWCQWTFSSLHLAHTFHPGQMCLHKLFSNCLLNLYIKNQLVIIEHGFVFVHSIYSHLCHWYILMKMGEHSHCSDYPKPALEQHIFLPTSERFLQWTTFLAS